MTRPNRHRSVATAVALCATIIALAPAASAAPKRGHALPPPTCPVAGAVTVASPELAGLEALAGCTVKVLPEETPEDIAANDEAPGTVVVLLDGSERVIDNEGRPLDPTQAAWGPASEPGSTVVRRTRGSGDRVVTIIAPSRATAAVMPTPPSAMPRATVPGVGAPATASYADLNSVSTPRPIRADLGSDAGLLALGPRSYSTRYDSIVRATAQRHRIDPLFLHAVIKQESAYRERAVSHAGAVGMMQIMPGTGAMLGVARHELTDPVTNIDAGARLLRRLALKYDGKFDLVLAAYNAGEGAVQKFGNRVPPYRETQDYVVKVMGHYNRLAAENGLPAGRTRPR